MKQPNIVVLHCDQLRWDCLGFNGNKDIKTPNLDKFAADSVNYCNQFTVYPICTPSRYSLWSGMYVHRHGAWDNELKKKLETGQSTQAEYLEWMLQWPTTKNRCDWTE